MRNNPMEFRRSKRRFKLGCIVYALMHASSLYASCTTIIDIANRPNIADSPCSVPFKKVFIELNYIDQQLPDHAGFQQNFPNALIRIGLPENNELFIQPPTYLQQKKAPQSGSTVLSSGIKHSINYNDQWIFAVEGVANIPSGSYYYGNKNWGTTFNGIANYSLNEHCALTAMLGVSRTSEAAAQGGRYFNSINPDVTLSYAPNQYLSLYGEVYGQSSIGVSEGAGFNFDAGFQILVSPNMIVNLSAGQQLYNYLGGFKHYVNAGISVML